MAKPNILDEIEKKSQEIMRSNEELAAKLRGNQEVITRFSDELDSLRTDLGGEGIKPGTKKELEKLKSDLEEKRILITKLLDDLKPFEVDIARREDTLDALNQRIHDQASRIESLSKELVEHKRQVQQLGEANTELKKKVTEKESLLQVTKDKLTGNTTALRETERENHRLHEEMDSQKKEVFILKNRIGAMEKRIHSTDEQNQKILYEMVRVKEQLKSAEEEILEKDKILEFKDAEHARNMESLKKEEEDKKLMIMKNHAKKMAIMNAAIASLKTKLENHKSLIEEKAGKERALITEFNNRMRDLMAARVEIAEDVGNIDTSFAVDEEPVEDEPSFVVEEPPENIATVEAEETTGNNPGISRIDEIIPMIELATDHGDSTDQIMHSLLSSGYSKNDIDDAFSKLNLG